VPPEVKKFRRRVAAAVAVAVILAFAVLFRYIWRVFTPESFGSQRNAGWGLRKYWIAYLIVIHAGRCSSASSIVCRTWCQD
jgi:hypothetical protein